MASNSFDFDKYNKLMKGANTGLKLHLSIQLLKDVVGALEHFNNPLEVEVRPIYNDLREFQVMYKDAAKKIVNARTNDAEAEKAGGRTQIDLDALNKMQAQIAELTAALAAKAA